MLAFVRIYLAKLLHEYYISPRSAPLFRFVRWRVVSIMHASSPPAPFLRHFPASAAIRGPAGDAGRPRREDTTLLAPHL